jgi:hypothetical protein
LRRRQGYKADKAGKAESPLLNSAAIGHSISPKALVVPKRIVTIDFLIASIQGTWQGDGPSAKNFVGTILSVNAPSITLSWANGMDGHNTLSGRLTPVSAIIVFQENTWHLNGSVTAYDANNEPITGAGPGNVSGNGHPPFVEPPALP